MKAPKNRYLISRRAIQLLILTLFVMGNYTGYKWLVGNFSSAKIAGVLSLTDPFAVLQLLSTGFAVNVSLLVSASIILIVYAILGGRTFCAWVCPVNIVADTARSISKHTPSITNKTFRLSSSIRYYILAATFPVCFFLGYPVFESISPIGFLHRGIIFGFGSSWALIVFLFLVDCLLLSYTWCGHLCPLGAFYSLVGKYGIVKVKHEVDNCTNCKKCFNACPEPQILSIVSQERGLIKSGQCTNCGRCIEVCNDNAMSFTLNYKKLENN